MNQVISWLRTIRARLLFTVFWVLITSCWVVIALLMGVAIGSGKPLAAQASTLTPEAIAYQDNSADRENAQEQDGLPNKELIERSRQQLKNRADNVREQLNVAEPTQEFLDTVRDKTQEAVKKTQQAVERTSDTLTGNQ